MTDYIIPAALAASINAQLGSQWAYQESDGWHFSTESRDYLLDEEPNLGLQNPLDFGPFNAAIADGTATTLPSTVVAERVTLLESLIANTADIIPGRIPVLPAPPTLLISEIPLVAPDGFAYEYIDEITGERVYLDRLRNLWVGEIRQDIFGVNGNSASTVRRANGMVLSSTTGRMFGRPAVVTEWTITIQFPVSTFVNLQADNTIRDSGAFDNSTLLTRFSTPNEPIDARFAANERWNFNIGTTIVRPQGSLGFRFIHGVLT